MYQVQEAYERQKEEENRRLEIFNRKEEELRERDRAVQEKFVEFSKVINENDAKLQRALTRIEEERKAIEVKLAKKKELEDQLHELKEKVQELNENVTRMKVYEEFLENVRQTNSEEFTDINDILNLDAKLSSANSELSAKFKELEHEQNELKLRKDDLEKKKSEEILQLNNDIAQLGKLNEEMDVKRSETGKALEQTSAGAISKQVEIGHIFMAIDNLHSRCKTEVRIGHNTNFVELPSEKADDVNAKTAESIEKLRIIKAYLTDYRAVIKELPQHILDKSVTARRESNFINDIKNS